MPISKKDKDFIEKVAEYFCTTKSLQEPDGSIRDTAVRFNLNRNKVRKILITMGELKSPITKKVVNLRKRGMTIKEISAVRNCRAYEREQLKRQVGYGATKKGEISDAWEGDKIKGQKTNSKRAEESQGNIEMSYIEAYSRPHRDIWTDRKEKQTALESKLKEEAPEKRKEFSEEMNFGAEGKNDQGLFFGGRLPSEPVKVIRLHIVV